MGGKEEGHGGGRDSHHITVLVCACTSVSVVKYF